jgi:glycosyltransferase involved in cell wall biosynthesis
MLDFERSLTALQSMFREKRTDASEQTRILAIVPAPRCFGLQNITLEFFSRISSQASCHFLCSRWSDGEFQRRLEELNLPYTLTWLGMFSRRLDRPNLKMTVECFFRLPAAYMAFLSLVIRFRPDVVYFATHHEIILFWPLLLLFRRKVVCHMHDPPPAIPFQKLSFFFWRQAVGRFLFVSENVRARLSSLGSLNDRDRVIYNGVEIRDLDFPRKRSARFRQKFQWPENSLIVGITGQMIPNKGHEDLLRAIYEIKNIARRVRLVIAGRNEGQFFSRLSDLVQQYGIQDIVGFAQWSPEVREFFQAVDIFVLASRHDEGFGLVVAEAGERGLPVICTRSGGAIEVVVDEQTGLIVEKQNPCQIAQALQRLSKNEGLVTEMGRRARQRICKMFNIEVQAAEFLTLMGD